MAKKVPLRTCVGCREAKSKKEMIRIVKTPEGNVILDLSGRANGRGAYLCKSSRCLEEAYKHKGLERSLKVPIDAGVYERIKKEMEAFEK